MGYSTSMMEVLNQMTTLCCRPVTLNISRTLSFRLTWRFVVIRQPCMSSSSLQVTVSGCDRWWGDLSARRDNYVHAAHVAYCCLVDIQCLASPQMLLKFWHIMFVLISIIYPITQRSHESNYPSRLLHFFRESNVHAAAAVHCFIKPELLDSFLDYGSEVVQAETSYL